MKISLICLLCTCFSGYASNPIDSLRIPLSDFTSLTPGSQDASMHIPAGFSFQTIAQRGDALSDGNTFANNFDFTGFIPTNGSENGHLALNFETFPGAVAVMDFAFNPHLKRWTKSNGKMIDFSGVAGTLANCSGAVTPWNTVVTCEEAVSTSDANSDGYYDSGWAIEIDPVSKTVVNDQKLWALGNFKHENLCIHENQRTVYQGVDDRIGYLYKFVADAAKNLSSGKLYVYVGSKNGTGTWELLNNSTPAECNSVLSQSAAKGATVFDGIEDVEINPINGWIYLAVKDEHIVYRFQDSDSINGLNVLAFETFVGGEGTYYDLETSSGIITELWGEGSDNLAFDNDGNLWVLQDVRGNGKNYLWVVNNNHTQASPDVRIFMRTPYGSEPTGITFSPDNRFLFMSIQHPSGSNSSAAQNDVNGLATTFNRDAAIVIARDENWGLTPCSSGLSINQNPDSGYFQSSSNMQSTAAINPSKIIDYRATKSVELNPGFSTVYGAVFRANIGGCL